MLRFGEHVNLYFRGLHWPLRSIAIQRCWFFPLLCRALWRGLLDAGWPCRRTNLGLFDFSLWMVKPCRVWHEGMAFFGFHMLSIHQSGFYVWWCFYCTDENSNRGKWDFFPIFRKLHAHTGHGLTWSYLTFFRHHRARSTSFHCYGPTGWCGRCCSKRP